MLIMIVCLLTSCASQQVIEVKTIPVLPKPAIPVEPAAPDLADAYPQPITITAEEASYFADICNEYGDPDYDPAEIYERTKLTRAAACEWAISGFNAQQIFNLETIFLQIADWADRMKTDRKTLVDMINDYYEMSDKAQRDTIEALKEEPEEKKFLGIF